MSFTAEQIQEFIDGIKDPEMKNKASDLLSQPDKLESLLSAHHKANEEARINRQSMKAIMAAGGFNFSNSELTELANNIDEIFAEGDFSMDKYTEIMEKYGARELIENGELDPEELGLIVDESTNEIFFDQDDGEVYVDENGYLIDGNGYYVDEDGDYVDEPVNEEDILDPYEIELQSEYEAKMLELEQKEQMLKKKEVFTKYGVNPEYVDDFSKIYRDVDAVDGSEPSEEQITEHFTKLKADPRYAGFFVNANVPTINTHGSWIQDKPNSAKEQAIQNKDVLGVIAATKYET